MATHSSTLALKIPWTEEPGVWDLSSLARDGAWAPGSESRVLTTGPPRKSLFDVG